jgi:hypothetical protein
VTRIKQKAPAFLSSARGRPRLAGAHHPLCIFDEKALGRWREIEVPQGVVHQAVDGGLIPCLRVALDRRARTSHQPEVRRA